MARERWFYAPTHKRQGPVALAQLVEGLLRLPDPRTCLVWKHGLPAWTPAGDVAEVDQHLAPFVVARKPATSPHPERHVETGAAAVRGEARSERMRARAGAARAARAAGPSPLVYAGAGAGLVVLAALVWLFWPKAPPKTGTGGASPGVFTLNEGGGAAGGPGGTGLAGASPGQAGFAGWSDKEEPLPTSELPKLRAVAAWSDKSLEVTLYNGSTWRITELTVTPSRLVKDNFVDDMRVTLLPVGIPAEQGVDQLMNKVAPNRRRAGVNPLDTGKFVGLAGNRPEAFRAPITGASGYPPR